MKNIGALFSENLKKHRINHGYSQEALAAKCGLHRTYISQLERQIKSPSLDTLHKLSVALEIDICSLITDTDS